MRSAHLNLRTVPAVIGSGVTADITAGGYLEIKFSYSRPITDITIQTDDGTDLTVKFIDENDKVFPN